MLWNADQDLGLRHKAELQDFERHRSCLLFDDFETLVPGRCVTGGVKKLIAAPRGAIENGLDWTGLIRADDVSTQKAGLHEKLHVPGQDPRVYIGKLERIWTTCERILGLGGEEMSRMRFMSRFIRGYLE